MEGVDIFALPEQGKKAAAAAEPPPLRRIEFHPARLGSRPVDTGDFRLVSFSTDAQKGSAPLQQAMPFAPAPAQAAATAAAGKDSHEKWADSELSFRMTFRKIGAGLANLGNTCFLNSVLQCLTYTEPFAAYLHSGKHKSSCRASGFCALCALQNHVLTALRSSGKILSPLHLVKNLQCISRDFRSCRQQDAHECMIQLLNSMHKCSLPSGVPIESSSAYEKSLVHKIFGGLVRSQVKCLDCSFCSDKYDPFLDLSLEIAKASSVVKALKNFTEGELLQGGEDGYRCGRCQKKVEAVKRLTIHKAPYVLTIHLKRYKAYCFNQKNDKKVEFEPTLNLKPFMSDFHERDIKYNLYGVLVHAGHSTHSGHYYCFVRTSTGLWHSLDDNQVRPVSERTVLAQKAYMLFYVRERTSTHERPDNVVDNANSVSHLAADRTAPPSVSNMNGANKNGYMLSSSLYKYGNIISHTSSQSIICTEKLSKGDSELQNNGDGIGNAVSRFQKVDEAPVQNGSVHQDSNCKFSNSMQVITQHSAEKSSLNGSTTVMLNSALEATLKNNGTIRNTVENKSQISAIDNQVTGKCPTPNKELHGLSSTTKSSPEVNKDGQGLSDCTKEEVNSKLHSNGFSETSSPNRKKRVKCSEKGLFLGGRRLFLSSSLYQRKRKFKKIRKSGRDAKFIIGDANLVNVTSDQQTSTSKTLEHETISGSLQRKRSRLESDSRKHVKKKKTRQPQFPPNIVSSMDRKESEQRTVSANASLVGNRELVNDPRQFELPGLSDSKENIVSVSCEERVNSSESLSSTRRINGKNKHQQKSLSLLLSGVPVPRWDDESSIVGGSKVKRSLKRSIGYVLDEWDEEYDRGRMKKVKNHSHGVDLSNPFQEVANYKARPKMKLVSDQTRSGHQPLRL